MAHLGAPAKIWHVKIAWVHVIKTIIMYVVNPQITEPLIINHNFLPLNISTSANHKMLTFTLFTYVSLKCDRRK